MGPFSKSCEPLTLGCSAPLSGGGASTVKVPLASTESGVWRGVSESEGVFLPGLVCVLSSFARSEAFRVGTLGRCAGGFGEGVRRVALDVLRLLRACFGGDARRFGFFTFFRD